MKKIFRSIWQSPLFGQLKVLTVQFLKLVNIRPGRKWIKRLGSPKFIKLNVLPGKPLIMHGTNLNLENKLFWEGIYGHEPATFKIFESFVLQVDWVIDVGANTGLYALFAKVLKPEIHVAAFEPHPFFYDVLVKNNTINNFNIITLQQALSNVCGDQPFYFAGFNQGNVYSSSLEIKHFHYHQEGEPQISTIKTTTLEKSLGEWGWGGQGLIKIDAEGHDQEVIEGLGTTILHNSPIILVEIQGEQKAISIKSLPMLKEYNFYAINDATGEKLGPLNIPFIPGCNNYLLLPKLLN